MSTKIQKTEDNDEKNISTTENIESGLYLKGLVYSRSKRLFDNERERTTYELNVNGFKQCLYVWGEHDYFEVGKFISVPVFVQTFTTQKGKIGHNLTLLNDSSSAPNEVKF
jgi:hypothetical protein